MSIPREKSTEIKIGLFTVLGALLLVLIVVILGKERKLFEESYFLYASFPDVAGLWLSLLPEAPGAHALRWRNASVPSPWHCAARSPIGV